MDRRVRAGVVSISERIRLVRILSRTSPLGVAALGATHVTVAVVSPLTAVAGGAVVSAMHGTDPHRSALAPVLVLGGLLFLGQIGGVVRESLDSIVAMRIDGRVRSHVRRLALAPQGIEHLESSGFVDDAMRSADRDSALGRSRSLGAAATGQVTVVFRMLSVLCSSALLSVYFPILASLLLAVLLVVRSVIRRQWTALATTLDDTADGQRRLYYFSDLMVRGATTEIRLFGLADWLGRRFRAAAFAAIARTWRQLWSVLRQQWWTVVVLAATAAVAFGIPAAATLAGRLDPAGLVTCMLAATGMFAVTSIGPEAFDLEYGLSSLRALDRLNTRVELLEPPEGQPTTTRVIRAAPQVVFEDVCFTYPGTEKPILTGLSLTLRPGEAVALVGANGAGKSTLVKLLVGLYRPTSGSITVDGSSTSTLDLRAWRSRISVLFQDFVRYPASLRDNISLSAPGVDDDSAVTAALHAAGIGNLAATLPAGLDTPLRANGEGGTGLSGGQWQRIGIARVLFAASAGRRLLVLDEPTAHLDMRAEAEFYDRVVRSVKQTTVVLVSHRLSTLRAADRIVMLADGRVAEQGSHAELLELGGRYAHFFRLQAKPFLEQRR